MFHKSLQQQYNLFFAWFKLAWPSTDPLPPQAVFTHLHTLSESGDLWAQLSEPSYSYMAKRSNYQSPQSLYLAALHSLHSDRKPLPAACQHPLPQISPLSQETKTASRAFRRISSISVVVKCFLTLYVCIQMQKVHHCRSLWLWLELYSKSTSLRETGASVKMLFIDLFTVMPDLLVGQVATLVPHLCLD